MVYYIKFELLDTARWTRNITVKPCSFMMSVLGSFTCTASSTNQKLNIYNLLPMLGLSQEWYRNFQYMWLSARKWDGLRFFFVQKNVPWYVCVHVLKKKSGKWMIKSNLTSSHWRPYKHAIGTADQRASKRAFRFLCVLAGALSTRHACRVVVAPDLRTHNHFSESMGPWFGGPEQKALSAMNVFTLLWIFA